MKRIFAFVLTIGTALLLTACNVAKMGSSGTRKNGLGTPFSAAVSITIDRLEAEGEIKRFGGGVWEIEFSQPNTLSGVKLEFSEGNVIASYKGLSFSVPQSAVSVKAMMLNLIKAVEENSGSDELSGEEKNGLLSISGRLDGGDYTLTVDKDGLLSGFDMPNNKLVMRFSELRTADITAEQETSEAPSENVTETAAVASEQQ